jgi:uncharacterized membrane protein YfcA
MIEGLTPLQLVVSSVIVFAAFVVRGMSGFGAGMIGIPLLAFLMPVHKAVTMFGLMVLFLFVFLSIRDWGEVAKDELRRLIVPTLLGVAAGAMHRISQESFSKLMAVLLLIAGVSLLLK